MGKEERERNLSSYGSKRRKSKLSVYHGRSNERSESVKLIFAKMTYRRLRSAEIAELPGAPFRLPRKYRNGDTPMPFIEELGPVNSLCVKCLGKLLGERGEGL